MLVNLGERFQPVGRHPGFAGRPPPCRHDEAYRHIECGAQGLAKVVGRSREVAHAGTIGLVPLARHVLLWRQRHVALDSKQAQARVLAMQQFLCRSLHRLLFKALHLHLHVRLSGTDPHLANHHVVQHDGFTVSEGYRIGTASLWRLHLDAKTTVLTGCRHIRLLVPRRQDIHLLSWLCPSPDVTLRLLLQHHVVAEERRQLDLGICCDDDERTDGADKLFHIIVLF